MTQSLTTLPPAFPTLDLGPATGNYNASGFTKFASSAIVTGDVTDKILGLQVRIDTGNGTLGVVNGEALQTSGISGNITYSYIAGTKLLRLTDNTLDGSAIGSDFQAVLRNVAISGASGDVSISANLGKPVYRSENGHYYEFVSVAPKADGSLPTWTTSNTSAQASTFLGLQGYLASVTSAQENAFLTATFDSRGWIGAQANADPAAPNDPTKRIWTWVGAASPENGKSFWIGGTSAGPGSPVAGTYANWDPTPAPGEPNNYLGNESYAQFTTGGFWNDLANTPTPSSEARYNPDGYWIEYSEAAGANNLAATRDTIALTPGSSGPSALDLAFYDPATGKVSFAFVGPNNTIANEGLTGDTPLLTFNPSNTPYAGSTNWGLVSANVDVDNDGVKDTIFTNKTDGSVVVAFGAAQTGTRRENAFRSNAVVTNVAGNVVFPKPSDGWSLDFASNKIGAGGTPGLFWRNSISGLTIIWTLSTSNSGNTVTAVGVQTIDVGQNSGWKALGDGEFTQDTTTREILWLNSKTNEVGTWSLVNNRTSLTAKYAALTTVPVGWSVAAIGNISGVVSNNDNIVWQNGTTVSVWNMKDGAIATTGVAFTVVTLTAADRIKAIADVDGDNVLDLVGQNDGNGTIASYALTSSFALKNTGPATRTQYASNNPTYRPAKGGPGAQLELVNVAQYDAPNVAA